MADSFERVLERVLEIAQRSTPPGSVISAETSLIRDLSLDSLQALELVSDVEMELGVGIPSEMLPEIDTLADVARIVVRVQSSDSQ
ncbi:MAG: acyl carrier protein [Bdellovibrionota bacterium]